MKIKIFIIILFLLMFFNVLVDKTYAACAGVPLSGNYTVSTSCAFANTIDGVDSGTGTTNNAVLTIQSSRMLTVNENTTIAFGSIEIQKPSNVNGAIWVNNANSALVKAPIWVPDADSDGYPTSANPTMLAQTSQPANHRRRNLFSSVATADCLDSDAAKYQNITGYTDSDADTYGAGGSSQVCSGASLPAGYSANSTDCDDATNTKWQNINGYLDADADTYTTGGAVAVCSGASLPAYNASTSPYRAGVNGSDCNDGSASLYVNRTGYDDSDGDTYGAGGSSQVCSGASLPAGYSANSTDCDDTKANAHPGQTTYYTTKISDNTYDWNCDGSDTKRYPSLTTLPAVACYATIQSGNPGYQSSVPACGSSGTYRWCKSCGSASCGGTCTPQSTAPCSASYVSWSVTTSATTQSCR